MNPKKFVQLFCEGYKYRVLDSDQKSSANVTGEEATTCIYDQIFYSGYINGIVFVSYTGQNDHIDLIKSIEFISADYKDGKAEMLFDIMSMEEGSGVEEHTIVSIEHNN